MALMLAAVADFASRVLSRSGSTVPTSLALRAIGSRSSARLGKKGTAGGPRLLIGVLTAIANSPGTSLARVLIAGVGFASRWCLVKRVEKFFLTAANDGRYQTRDLRAASTASSIWR